METFSSIGAEGTAVARIASLRRLRPLCRATVLRGPTLRLVLVGSPLAGLAADEGALATSIKLLRPSSFGLEARTVLVAADAVGN